MLMKIPVVSDIMERDAVSIGRSQTIFICNTNVIMRPRLQFSCHFATVAIFKIKKCSVSTIEYIVCESYMKGKVSSITAGVTSVT